MKQWSCKWIYIIRKTASVAKTQHRNVDQKKSKAGGKKGMAEDNGVGGILGTRFARRKKGGWRSVQENLGGQTHQAEKRKRGGNQSELAGGGGGEKMAPN